MEFSEDITNIIHFEDKDEKTDGWHVTLEPVANDVEILGRWEDGGVAVIQRKIGKGSVIVSGGNFSAFVHDNQNCDVPSVFKRLMKNANLATNESRLWTATRCSDEYEYNFAYNTGKELKRIPIIGETVYVSEECSISDGYADLPLYAVIIQKRKIKE